MTDAAASTVEGKPKRHLPGEEGMWAFIWGDLLVFTIFFNLFSYYRAHDVALFEHCRELLSRWQGLINTLLLLTGSLFVAVAVSSAREGRHQRAGRLLLCGIACSVGFGVSKVIEYTIKIRHGYTLQTNDFFMFYYMLTGIHMVHVIVATAILVFLWAKTRAPEHDRNYIALMESGGIFWHMVDLLWVVLFALLYLLV